MHHHLSGKYCSYVSLSERATYNLNLKKWALQATLHIALVPAIRTGWRRCDVQAQDRRVKEEMKGGMWTCKKKNSEH